MSDEPWNVLIIGSGPGVASVAQRPIGAVNRTLTIIANAKRVADIIAKRL